MARSHTQRGGKARKMSHGSTTPTNTPTNPDQDIDRPAPIRLPKPDACCESPCDPPWLTGPTCIVFQETVDLPFNLQGELITGNRGREEIEVQITYRHTLCRIGKQHGGLAYTFTLLPGEKTTLYHSDRYRRTTSEEARFSVQTTFSQFVSALYQAQTSQNFSQLNQVLNNQSSSSGASGGGGFSLFGLINIGGGGSSSNSSSSSSSSSTSVQAAASQFAQVATEASQYTDLQRSITVSSYEDAESVNVTSRVIQNDNQCRAVTYFVRKVLDVYVATTTVVAISVRVIEGNAVSSWLTPAQENQLKGAALAVVKKILSGLPKIGDRLEVGDVITVPTDGVVYDPELAHCCTCDPEREESIRIKLERERAEAIKTAVEARLLEQEVQRRELLLAAGTLDPFEPAEVKA
jgi:hypothetical protein